MEKNNVEELNIRDLAIEIGFSYLEGGYGYWSDAAGRYTAMIQWIIHI